MKPSLFEPHEGCLCLRLCLIEVKAGVIDMRGVCVVMRGRRMRGVCPLTPLSPSVEKGSALCPRLRSRPKHPSSDRPRPGCKSCSGGGLLGGGAGGGQMKGARPRPPLTFAGHNRGGAADFLRESWSHTLRPEASESGQRLRNLVWNSAPKAKSFCFRI